MRSAGVQQFSYETFVAAHQSDPRLQSVVTNFNKDSISFKQSEVDDLNAPQDNANNVASMAQRATDLGDKL
jgi:hypothetical protein